MSLSWLLLVSCGLALVIVWRGRLPRFEKISVALFVVVVACVAVGSVLSSSMGPPAHGDGRALLACAAGPALTLLLRERLAQRGGVLGATVASTGLLALGVVAHATTIAAPTALGSRLAVGAALGATIIGATAAVAISAVRARTQPSQQWRARAVSELAAAGLLGVAGVVGAIPAELPVRASPLWAGVLAVAAVLLTAARAAPRAPGVDVVVVALAAVALGVVAVPLALVPAVVVTAVVASVTARAIGPQLPAAAVPANTSLTTGNEASLPLPLAGLASTVPLLDDALLRRPSRPRVLSRTSARRIVDAAVERAWRAQPGAERRRAPVDVSGGDDADVDGDAVELAEALCAIVDNALKVRGKADGDGARVRVVVRAAAQTISVEVHEAATSPSSAEGWRPFFDHDASSDRPGYGASLSRARLAVERHGGQLHVRAEGVQVTLPRRMVRGPVGIA